MKNEPTNNHPPLASNAGIDLSLPSGSVPKRAAEKVTFAESAACKFRSPGAGELAGVRTPENLAPDVSSTTPDPPPHTFCYSPATGSCRSGWKSVKPGAWRVPGSIPALRARVAGRAEPSLGARRAGLARELFPLSPRPPQCRVAAPPAPHVGAV